MESGKKCRCMVSFPDYIPMAGLCSLMFHILTFLAVFLAGDIIGSVMELQSLTFDQTADKEKQKSEAKHIQMQKQRALSDLFKTLAKTGEL